MVVAFLRLQHEIAEAGFLAGNDASAGFIPSRAVDDGEVVRK